jgi:hypothetical protein
MLTPEELATIEAFMGGTENIDEYKRALAVVSLMWNGLSSQLNKLF